MFEIVNNKRNGIDVDKFDYMSRDSEKVGVHHLTFNRNVIMTDARVVDN